MDDAALEEGEQLIERDELLAARGERAKPSPGTNQHTQLVGAESAPTKTTAIIAAEAGFSERTAQERKQAARDIAADVKDAIQKDGVNHDTHNRSAGGCGKRARSQSAAARRAGG